MANYVSHTLGFIILAEFLSFLSFQYPQISPWIFGMVTLTALILTIKNLEWGIWLVFGELVIGSFGKLFVLQISGVELSIRVVLWLIVMSVWLARVVRTRRIAFLDSQFFKPYAVLAAVLIWGVAWGLGRDHDFGAVFFDVNNYLYFALVLPVYEVLSRRDKTCLVPTMTIITAAILWLSVKTIILFYIFSHELFGLQDVLYAWSRRMQLAEITSIGPTVLASRIFMQSQVWILFGLFMALGYLFYLHKEKGIRNKEYFLVASSLLLAVTAVVMSLSRSFWLAAIVALVLMIGWLLFVFRDKFSSVLRFSGVAMAVIALGVGVTLGVANFPIPRGSSGSAAVAERATKFSGEAAASSRVAQIRPLLTAVAKHPVIGSGFGQAATYQSQDPRIVKSHPGGWYTTTAFELGWLEMWLKIGLVGAGVYLYLLWRIIRATRIREWHANDANRYLILGSVIGLVALVVTHGFSPYLNHPLGIGIVILLTSYVSSANPNSDLE